MTQVLSRRALNRATLARQLLLARADLSAYEAVEQLAGMQSQAPLAPYVGLWSRLAGFDPAELSDLTESNAVVRTHLMRNTVHLVSARDCLAWRSRYEQLHAGEFRARFGGVGDPAAVAAYARELLDECPRSRAELGRALAERWPDAAPAALAYAATHHLALMQVPPRGLWGRTGPAAWATVESRLGAVPDPAPAVDDMVLRCLGAFGPASAADVQVWSGLTRLREVLDRLDLVRFRDEDGRELYDLQDAPRPDPDTPAPPRFLPEYDNLLLSYADRGRVIVDGRRVPLPPGAGARTGTLLVDGVWCGTWSLAGGEVRVEPFTPLGAADRAAVDEEAAALTAFLTTPATRPHPPPTSE